MPARVRGAPRLVTYRVGRDAKALTLVRAVLPDRAFDFALTRVMWQLESAGAGR